MPVSVSYTLQSYRRALAERLGRYGSYTTSSVSISATATRELICSTLVDSDANANALDGIYVYVVGGTLAGQQRRVSRQGYTASTGTLLINREFASAPATSVNFELHGRLPAIATDNVPGLRELLNQALQACWYVDRLSFSGTTNVYHYSVSSYPWLKRQEQIGPAYQPLTDTNDNPLPLAGGARLRIDGQTPLLEIRTSVATGDTFQVDVLRYGHTLIKSSGSWVESTTGLTEDTDEALIDQDLIVEIALAKCYATLASIGAPGDRAHWSELAKTQAIKATVEKDRKLPKFNIAAWAGDGRWSGWPKGLFDHGGSVLG